MKNNSFIWGYISGLIDGEGNVNPHSGYITITNTTPEIIKALEHGLSVLGITYTTVKRKSDGNSKHTQVYNIHISGFNNITKILKGCEIYHPVKKERLTKYYHFKCSVFGDFNERINILKQCRASGLSLRKSCKTAHINTSVYYRTLLPKKLV